MEQPLTKEQRERIKKNRERALELRKRKLEEAASSTTKQNVWTTEKQPTTTKQGQAKKPAVVVVVKDKQEEKEEETVELEDFEVGASDFVTKTEAMKMYCLPEGTLAVCKFIEKQNPRHKGWNAMKLYYRNEIRKRSRERHGGMEGLIRERNERAHKRFKKDLEKTKDVFR